MSEISMASGKLNVGGVFNQAFATLQAKTLFFVFTGLMFGIAHLALSRSGINGPDPSAISPGLVLVGILLLLVLGAITQILAARATEGPLGTNASLDFAPAVQAALPRLPNVILTTLAVLFLVFLGLTLILLLLAFVPSFLSYLVAKAVGPGASLVIVLPTVTVAIVLLFAVSCLPALVAVIVYQHLRAQVAGSIPAEQPETDGVPA